MGEAPRRGGDILFGWEKFEAVIVCDVLALLGVLLLDGKCERAVWVGAGVVMVQCLGLPC